jgi:hypothetical protein
MDERVAALTAWLIVSAALFPAWRPGTDSLLNRRTRIGLVATLAAISAFVLLDPPAPGPVAALPSEVLNYRPTPGPLPTALPVADQNDPGADGSRKTDPSLSAMRFAGHRVVVSSGNYTIYDVGSDGVLHGSRAVSFNARSWGAAVVTTASNGLRHWRMIAGDYTGWSYVAGLSGDFDVVAVYRSPQGETLERPLGRPPPGDRLLP